MHKRVSHTKRCEVGFSYQLCNANINTTKVDPNNTAWIAGTSHIWAKVTCPKCLGQKELAKRKSKIGRTS